MELIELGVRPLVPYYYLTPRIGPVTVQLFPQQFLRILRLKVPLELHGSGDGHAQSGAEHQAGVVSDGSTLWVIRHLHLGLEECGAEAPMHKFEAVRVWNSK